MTLSKPEIRHFSTAEIRMETVDEKPLIRGFAIYYDSLSRDLGGFREIIRPGALKTALTNGNFDVRALINHDKNLILGRTKPGTLRLLDGDRGLYVEIDPPDTSYARDLAVSMERGDISGMSFRFYMFEDSSRGQTFERSPEGEWIREITEFAAIDDVSIVTYPAYDDASAAIRSFEAFQESLQPAFNYDAKALELRMRLAEYALKLN